MSIWTDIILNPDHQIPVHISSLLTTFWLFLSGCPLRKFLNSSGWTWTILLRIPLKRSLIVNGLIWIHLEKQHIVLDLFLDDCGHLIQDVLQMGSSHQTFKIFLNNRFTALSRDIDNRPGHIPSSRWYLIIYNNFYSNLRTSIPCYIGLVIVSHRCASPQAVPNVLSYLTNK